MQSSLQVISSNSFVCRYFLNIPEFSMKFSLRGISSNLLLWKQKDSWVVMYTWTWHGKRAASARAGLRESNAKHQEIIFTTGFAIRSPCQNAKETKIQVFALFWVLAKREPLRSAIFQFFLRAKHFLVQSLPPPLVLGHLCSITGLCISQKYFNYLSVHIFRILFQEFQAAGSDPLHKSMMWYWCYSSTLLSRWFPHDQNGQVEMFCARLVPAPKGQINRAGPWMFFHDS